MSHDNPFESVLSSILVELQAIRSSLHHLHTQGERIMAVSQAVLDALAALDKATSDIAADITALKGQIGTGMSQADVDSVVGQLTAKAAALEALAADPNNPVPK